MKLRFTFISFGVGWKRDAILRRPAKAKTRKKRKRTSFFAVLTPGLGAYVEFVNRPVQLTVSALPGPAPPA